MVHLNENVRQKFCGLLHQRSDHQVVELTWDQMDIQLIY